MHLNIVEMPIVPLFLFKLSVSLGVVWCFYQVVLRRLTFYNLNRWYLLGYTLLSFVIPLINIGSMLPDGPAGEPMVIQFIPALGGGSRGAVAAASSHAAGFSVWAVVAWVVAAGSVFLSVRVGVRWLSLIRLRRKARLIADGGVRIYQVDGPVVPFSFGNAIYINQQLHTGSAWEDIVLHEYVHIRQRHTVDILIAELVCIVNWYNPFAWLIRYSVRQNLEFIADQVVLDKGVDRKGYQYHLLKVVGEQRYRLANNFNFSSLKRRIIMMNRMRSARVNLLKMIFLLPLVAVLLVAFRHRYTGLLGSHGPVYVNAAGIVINSPDRQPLEGVSVRDTVTGLQTTTDANGYYKIRIPVSGNPVTVYLDYTKPGYDSDFRGRHIPDLKETIGILDVGVLHLLNRIGPIQNPLFIAPSFMKVPADPEYSDAVQEMNRAIRESDDLNRYMKLQKDHPEIGLFYTTEDRRKEIVIYMDGTIERYGYPGTPGLEELYKKYGKFDHYMATDHPEGNIANAGYLARWAAIGEQAQREFHTTNPNVRAVIFPGDSRVIAVPVNGKPKVYDMDNAAEVERTEFERLYGKLPDCVPKAGNNSDEMERKAGWPRRPAAGVRDTVPGGRRDTLTTFEEHALRSQNALRPLYLIDDHIVPADSIKILDPDRIASVRVLKDSAAKAMYGEKGRNGVVLIYLKGLSGIPTGRLYIVDGREMARDSVIRLNSNDIESVHVWKGEAAKAKYGKKGNDGVIEITLKDRGSLNAVPQGARDTLAGNKRGGN